MFLILLLSCQFGFAAPEVENSHVVTEEIAPPYGADENNVSEQERQQLQNLIRSTRDAQDQKTVVDTRKTPVYDAVADSSSSDAWKGTPSPQEWNAALLGGLAIFDRRAGFTFVGALAKKLVHQGFVPDINNQVFLEAEVGPVFLGSSTGVFWSGHLRWDFQFDESWRLFAIAGLGGQVVGSELGVFPRLAIGTMVTLNSVMALRFELSHEATLVGANFQF